MPALWISRSLHFLHAPCERVHDFYRYIEMSQDTSPFFNTRPTDSELGGCILRAVYPTNREGSQADKFSKEAACNSPRPRQWFACRLPRRSKTQCSLHWTPFSETPANKKHQKYGLGFILPTQCITEVFWWKIPEVFWWKIPEVFWWKTTLIKDCHDHNERPLNESLPWWQTTPIKDQHMTTLVKLKDHPDESPPWWDHPKERPPWDHPDERPP